MVNLVGGFLAKFTKDRQANKNKNLLADPFVFNRKRHSTQALGTFGRIVISALERGKKQGFEDGRVTKTYFSRLHTVEIACLTISIIGIGLSVIQYDLEFVLDEERQWSLVLLYFIFGASLILSTLTVVRYWFELQYLKQKGTIAEHETLFSTGMHWSILLEIIIIMIIPYPWLLGHNVTMKTLGGNSEIYYSVNSIIQIFSILRLAIVLRLIIQTTRWNDTRSQRLCDMYGVKNGLLFTLKCEMKTNPLILLLSAYVMSILLFGYVLRIAERPTDRISGNTTFFTYANSMWLTLATMATFGYGDYYPITFLGRMVVFFISIWGSSIVSLMVVTLTNLLSQSRLEEKSFTIINRVMMREKLKNLAASVITNLVRGNYTIKKNPAVSQASLVKLKRYLKQFKWTAVLYRELANEDNGFEVMDRQFTLLRDQIKGMRRKINYMTESNRAVMELIGVDPKIVGQLNKHLQSTVSLKESAVEPEKGIQPEEPKGLPPVEKRSIVNPSFLSNVSEGRPTVHPKFNPYSFKPNTNALTEKASEYE